MPLPAPCCALLLALVLGTCRLAAEEAAPPTPADMARAYASGDYGAVEALARRSLALHPEDGTASYDLACALAHQGHREEALTALAQAQAHGFEDADHTAEDSDLVSLHGEPRFAAVVNAMRAAPYAPQEPREEDWAIPGLLSLEGDPPGGMAYRVRIPASATAANPLRLVVWLHPSGGSMNQQVEPLAQELGEHGFALLVFTRKQWLGWSGGEATRILPTIAALAHERRLETHRPVLMAFSAGGQIALQLFAQQPTAWSGLLLDAAYPIDAAARRLLAATPAMAASHVPVHVLLGAQDANRGLWEQARTSWQGLPLTFTIVPEEGHAYLFRGEAWHGCLQWLEQLPHPRTR